MGIIFANKIKNLESAGNSGKHTRDTNQKYRSCENLLPWPDWYYCVSIFSTNICLLSSSWFRVQDNVVEASRI